MASIGDLYPELLRLRAEGLAKYGARQTDDLGAPPSRCFLPVVWRASQGVTLPAVAAGPLRVGAIGPSMRLAEEAVRARDRVKVLDVGCYTGQFREYLRLRKPARTIEYVGVDVAPPQVTFPIYTDLDAVPDRDFDLILMSEVAEHMPADVFVREYLARFPAMLASDGMLVVSVPNPTCPGALERDVTHVQHYPWYDLYALLRRHFGKVEVMRTHFIASPRRFCTLPLRWALSYALEFDWCEGLVLTARDPRPIPD